MAKKSVAAARTRRAKPKAAGSEVVSAAAADLWLGLQMRALRRAKGLSLKRLAEAAELSIAMVSQIERGISSPSIRSLRQLSKALGVAPSRFFQDGSHPPAAEVDKILRRNARPSMPLAANITKHLLTPAFPGLMEMFLIVLEPGGTSGPESYTHKGEDAGVVLRGTLELWVDRQRYILEEGDGFRFKSSLPHHFTNASEKRTEVIWVLSPPSWGKSGRTRHPAKSGEGEGQ
ncbi:cupin domain-containing protein [Hypericibacter sp.]|uniref:cupin domain-containing protein n=1 Tax=Hypericibacter sp. TaxID=2705401 RepID=UPI003D6D8C01